LLAGEMSLRVKNLLAIATGLAGAAGCRASLRRNASHRGRR